MSLFIFGMGPGMPPSRRSLRDRKKTPLPEDVREPGSMPPEQESPQREGEMKRDPRQSEMADLYRNIAEAEEVGSLIREAMQGLERAYETLSALNDRLSEVGPETCEQPSWLPELLRRLDYVARDTRFGSVRLLDGSLGCRGVALGDGLQFLGASELTRSSPPEGYEVRLSSEPVRATVLGERSLNEVLRETALELILEENGLSVRRLLERGLNPGVVPELLRESLHSQGLSLNVESTPEGRLLVQHHKFGAGYSFRVGSSISGVLSPVAERLRLVNNGRDIAGTLNGEPALGQGSVLRGVDANTTTAGLLVCYNGLPFTGLTDRIPRRRRDVLSRDVFVGRVIVASNALTLRVEGDPPRAFRLRLDSVRPEALALGEANESEFSSLAEIRLGGASQYRDSCRLAARALLQVRESRDRVKLLAGEVLFPSLARLRVKAQNLVAADPFSSGPAVFGAVVQVSESIRRQGRTALNAQPPPTRHSLVGLLGGEQEDPSGWG